MTPGRFPLNDDRLFQTRYLFVFQKPLSHVIGPVGMEHDGYAGLFDCH